MEVNGHSLAVRRTSDAWIHPTSNRLKRLRCVQTLLPVGCAVSSLYMRAQRSNPVPVLWFVLCYT
jgi:hypothetical protein